MSNFKARPWKISSIDDWSPPLAISAAPPSIIVMPITVPEEAEDRDGPDDHAEQAVAGVQPRGVEVGEVFQLVVQRVGRAAVADVLQRRPQAADVVFALPPPGQAVEPGQQRAARLDRLGALWAPGPSNGVAQPRPLQPRCRRP